MKLLTVPRANFTARDVFDACCAAITDADRKTRLAANASKIESASNDYAAAGAAATIHGISASVYQPYGTATAADFVWLYDQRMVRSSPGRVYYEMLRDGNRGGRCALCNVSPSSTLDHHLPKTEHPIFAVTPDNLLPACGDCNKAKLASLVPILNPYFDDLGTAPWLTVTVVPVIPAIFDFQIDAPADWSLDLTIRAKAHFELLGLSRIYAYEANRQITGIRHRLTNLLVTQGAVAVRAHLQEDAVSWTAGEPNSWEAALYTALASSDWFCGGGFAVP